MGGRVEPVSLTWGGEPRVACSPRPVPRGPPSVPRNGSPRNEGSPRTSQDFLGFPRISEGFRKDPRLDLDLIWIWLDLILIWIRFGFDFDWILILF